MYRHSQVGGDHNPGVPACRVAIVSAVSSSTVVPIRHIIIFIYVAQIGKDDSSVLIVGWTF